jgi:hypothetical protein
MPWRCMGKRRYSSTILDLGTRWRCVVSFPQQGKSPLYALDKRLGGPQSQSGLWGVKTSLAPAGNRTSSRPAPSSSLCRLSITDQTCLWWFNINRPSCRSRISHLSLSSWIQMFKILRFFPRCFFTALIWVPLGIQIFDLAQNEPLDRT